MTRPRDDEPGRLLDGGATDFEKRVLGAALRKGPPPEVSARMAAALGLSGAPVAPPASAAEASAAPTTAPAAPAAAWPWISAGLVALSLVGGFAGARAWRARHRVRSTPPPAASPASRLAPIMPTPSALSPAAIPSDSVAGTPSAPEALNHRGRTPALERDLHVEIAFIDGARAALAAGGAKRALELVHRYAERYPRGSFLPEAAALEIEALMRLGRDPEARTLAERFVATHRGSLLSERVAALAGLASR